jgi:signal transduction histidine kinase
MFGSQALPEQVRPGAQRRWAQLRPPRSDVILAIGLSLLVLVPPIVLTAPLAWRRRFPMTVFGLQAVVITLVDVDFRPELPAFVAILVGVYSVAAYHHSPFVSAAVLFVFGVAVATLSEDVVPPLPGPLTAFALLVPLWLAGNSSRLARGRLDASTTRARRAEQERDTAIAQERARIARELHDIVTHNVSVMVVQASAARQVLDVAVPAVPTASGVELNSARDAMAAVERVGQQAMAELRDMLGLLGGPVETSDRIGAPRSPQTGLDQLDALLQRVRHSGTPVSLDVSGHIGALPASVDLAAYRVVQEALTNVLRHAPGAATTVGIHCGPKELLVEIINEPAPEPPATSNAGGGRGLAGLGERLRLHHGELTAGPLSAGGYRVRARIPLAASSGPAS